MTVLFARDAPFMGPFLHSLRLVANNERKIYSLAGKMGRLTEQIEVISTSPKQLAPSEELSMRIVGLLDNQ